MWRTCSTTMGTLSRPLRIIFMSRGAKNVIKATSLSLKIRLSVFV
jgi:hypothetical protein